MRILLTTEREEEDVNVAQAHKEAQVGITDFTDLVLMWPVGHKCSIHFTVIGCPVANGTVKCPFSVVPIATCSVSFWRKYFK
jgi:hypothetical protein